MPEEFDELPNGGSGSVEDGATEVTAPATKPMFPSSFGMTFCVGLEAKALLVTARWGHYHRDRSETLTTKTGDKKIVWKRNQRAAVSEPIPLKVGRINWTPDAEFPQVQVQGLVRKRDDFWSITLFLVNGQAEPKKLRNTAWLFQHEMTVEAPDRQPVFHSRPHRKDPGKADPVSLAKEQEMAMLYRHQVEFGVGSIVELPNLSVMVMGLDDWPIEQGVSEVSEARLLKAVQAALGSQVARLLTPPVANESTSFPASPFEESATIGVPVAPFPRWQVCPHCRLLAPIQSGLFERQLDPYRKDKSRYFHRICKKPGKPPTVVPARFLVACEHGHLDDFPWVEFVHGAKTDCRYELRLDELGASGEVADIQVKCVKCDRKRRLSDAFSDEGRDELKPCKGRWPHLRKYDDHACNDGHPRAILLGASNSWFPIMLSVLSIPTATDKLGQLVEMNWPDLEKCQSAREVMLIKRLLKGLAAYTDEAIWEAVAKKKEASEGDEERSPDLRDPEWEVFSKPDPALNSRDFKLRQVDPPRSYRKVFSKVVLAERLREVRALVGFTRIESPGDYTELGDFPKDQRVPLSRKAPKWVPTSEVRGEGIFLQFSEQAIEEWVTKTREREGEFKEAHKR